MLLTLHDQFVTDWYFVLSDPGHKNRLIFAYAFVCIFTGTRRFINNNMHIRISFLAGNNWRAITPVFLCDNLWILKGKDLFTKDCTFCYPGLKYYNLYYFKTINYSFYTSEIAIKQFHTWPRKRFLLKQNYFWYNHLLKRAVFQILLIYITLSDRFIFQCSNQWKYRAYMRFKVSGIRASPYFLKHSVWYFPDIFCQEAKI